MRFESMGAFSPENNIINPTFENNNNDALLNERYNLVKNYFKETSYYLTSNEKTKKDIDELLEDPNFIVQATKMWAEPNQKIQFNAENYASGLVIRIKDTLGTKNKTFH